MTRLILFVFFMGFSLISGFSQDEPKFTLPELKYGFEALEPHIDAKTMEIHYSKHHKAYLDNLNKSGANTISASGLGTIEELMLTVDGKQASVRNNGGGHYNHTLFWEILSPSAKKMAEGKLATAIKNQFVSQDSLIKLMNAEGLKRFGSGWVWLIVTPLKTLAVVSTANQDNPLMNLEDMKRGVPVLGIDVWEHAYYLKHQNKRGEYLNTIWNVVDWAQVEKNYEAAVNSPLLKKIDKSSWKAYKEFNQLYSQINLPAQSGDYSLLKSKSGELVEKAEMLSKSNIPASFQNTDIKKIIGKVVSEVKDLSKAATKKPKDEVIKQKLADLQLAYTELMNIVSN